MVRLGNYLDSSTFYMTGEHDREFEEGRMLRLNQGLNGYVDVQVLATEYDSDQNRTLVSVSPALVQSSLVSIKRASSSAKSVAVHRHSGIGDGGYNPSSVIGITEAARIMEFTSLPAGTLGQVLQTDDSNALSFSYPNTVFPLVAGEELTTGQVVYQDSSDSGKCKLAQQDGTEAESDVIALVIDATIGLDAAGSMLLWGIVTNNTWTWTPGAVLYLSDTPGGMTETKPVSGNITRCGKALTSTTVLFAPIANLS